MNVFKKWRKSLPAGSNSVKDAAKLLGVSPMQVYRYEKGTRRVMAQRAREIAQITGIPKEILRPDIFGPDAR